MSTRDLDARIDEMEARGYRVQSRGTHAAVLTRGPQQSRRMARLLALAVSVTLAVFRLVRVSWPFIAVGLIGAALVSIDWWAANRSMTVRLTVDDSGRVQEQVIQSGDET